MLKKLAVAYALVAIGVVVSAQERKFTVDDFVGTWNIEVMSHQVALVIDKHDATKVTATMMMMGRDVPLKGELVERTLTLTGVKTDEATIPNHAGVTGPAAKPIVVTMQDDGTLTGEMMTSQGPVKWTAEKLKTRKKPVGAGQ
jgi:hypothetical protein